MKKIYLFIFILSILLINHGFLLSKTTKIKSKLQDLAVYQESLNVKTTSRETSRNWAQAAIHLAGHVLFALIYSKDLNIKKVFMDSQKVNYPFGDAQITTNINLEYYINNSDNFKIIYRELLESVGGHAAEMFFLKKWIQIKSTRK